ncbi:MAG: BrnT family toxin [Candidatus Acidiferrales bacterium]
MIHEWDATKAEQNLKKHGVSFNEATAVFRDPFALTIPDPDHSHGEERFVTIGLTTEQQSVTVVHTDRGEAIRLISARPATPKERPEYEEAKP